MAGNPSSTPAAGSLAIASKPKDNPGDESLSCDLEVSGPLEETRVMMVPHPATQTEVKAAEPMKDGQLTKAGR